MYGETLAELQQAETNVRAAAEDAETNGRTEHARRMHIRLNAIRAEIRKMGGN
ncbi:hypothetical protein KIH74_22690 [Kineosporia sp. J2-2]|uniref:Uncharacterized protein n=1 Tax=Kineosporia corallincola TaxID=2835133 RepID=A0ABS5TKZ3_9ACTN|nr:hypothetical protein [Kineosporia corallincola]MBT0771766.1 hypothetical protein [Kineosporia corallincola]